MGPNRRFSRWIFLDKEKRLFSGRNSKKSGESLFFLLNHVYKHNNWPKEARSVFKTVRILGNCVLESCFPGNKDNIYIQPKTMNKVRDQYDLHVLKGMMNYLWIKYHVFKEGNLKMQLDTYLIYIFAGYYQKYELNKIFIVFETVKWHFFRLFHEKYVKWMKIISGRWLYSKMLVKNLEKRTNCQENPKLFIFYQPNVYFTGLNYIDLYINSRNKEISSKRIQKQANIYNMWKRNSLYPLEQDKKLIYRNWNEILKIKTIRRIYGSKVFQRSYTKAQNKYSNIIQDIQDYIGKKKYNNCNKILSEDISLIQVNDLKQFQCYIESLLENVSKQGDIYIMNKILRLLGKLDHGMIDQSYFLIKTHLNLLLNTSPKDSYQKLLPKYNSETTFFYDSFKSSLPKVPTISHWKLILQFYIKANAINSLSFSSSLLINSLLQIQISKLKPSPEIYFMVIYALVVSPEFRPLGSDCCQKTQSINTTIRIKKVLEVVKLISNEIDFDIDKEKLLHALYLACCPSITEVLEYTTNPISSLGNQNSNNSSLILDPRAFLIEDLMILHKIPYSFNFEKLRFTVLASCKLWSIFWKRFKDISVREPQKDENFYVLIFKLINDSKNKKQIRFALETIWPLICEQLKINVTPKIADIINKLRNHKS
ncbi:hypothetical protein T552_02309 [Pneumocystis carinii B80]|uniref:Uncharacterized protein n=1 Tax=Pneumocystis carinii (strain B80) TaxID=1408658 RepID=A0A0W4ZG06_PNEC8|nr:hypothetical protein T552_02309 [Pneumocystis carinii B80]KTW27325.1 hypothetical protein T552_02309 [Pneumocystis carinii B80]